MSLYSSFNPLQPRMSYEHPKFQLVPDDINYLKDQLLIAADQKLNRDLPKQNDVVDDPLRRRVSQLLHQFTDDVFELAKHAMIINGKQTTDISSLGRLLSNEEDINIEPFDKELNSKLRDLYMKVDQATLKVTERRKRVPQEIRKLLEEEYHDRDGIIKQTIDSEQSQMSEKTRLSSDSLAKLSQLESLYNDIRQRINNLGNKLPHTYAELEQLQTTINYFSDKIT